MKHPTTLDFTGPELCALPAHEVVALLRRGEISPNDLLDASIARITAIEPAINAMPTTCFDRAKHEIAQLSQTKQHLPNQLEGLPIGIKDLTPVAGVRTTFGTLARKDFVPDVSDPLVELLERNGALVVGKTNTPELGAGGNTFNAVFGCTRNAWDTSLNAGGSSGGAAVSLATGEVWLSHGSDHGGSLRTPAAFNGIVGLRPTPGRAGGGPADFAFNIEGVQGPMARSVRDCALFLDAMAGFNPRNPIAFPAPNTPFQQTVIEAQGKIRIGYSSDLNGFFPVEPAISECLKTALNKVQKNGGHVDEATPELEHLDRTYHTLRGMLWATLGRNIPASARQYFKETLETNMQSGEALTVNDIVDADINRSTLYKNLTDYLDKYDVLACPVVGSMPRAVELEWVDEINGETLNGYMDWLRPSFLATVTGMPAISVPVGFSNGIPVGIQLIGPPRGEASLLAAARAVEIAVGGPLSPIDPNVTHEQR